MAKWKLHQSARPTKKGCLEFSQFHFKRLRGQGKYSQNTKTTQVQLQNLHLVNPGLTPPLECSTAAVISCGGLDRNEAEWGNCICLITPVDQEWSFPDSDVRRLLTVPAELAQPQSLVFTGSTDKLRVLTLSWTSACEVLNCLFCLCLVTVTETVPLKIYEQ